MSGHILSETLSAFVDAELDPVARSDVSAHLTECAACRDEAAVLVRLKAGLAGLPGPEASDRLTERIVEAAVRAVRPVERDAWERAFGLLRGSALAAAASVALILGGGLLRYGTMAPPSPDVLPVATSVTRLDLAHSWEKRLDEILEEPAPPPAPPRGQGWQWHRDTEKGERPS